MGAWNCSINGNDTAQDLMDEYRAAFYYNDVNTALQKIVDYVDYLDTDEIPDFVYSLADFMWKKGILVDSVKNKAIEMIDSNYGLKIWEEAGEKVLSKRKKVLEAFKKQLLSQQPDKKKISMKVNMDSIFSPGDVIVIELKTKDLNCSDYVCVNLSEIKKYDGKYVVLRKLYDHISWSSSIEPNVKDIWPVFQLLPYYYDEIPNIDDIEKLFNHDINYYEMIETDGKLLYFKKRNYKLIGNITNYLKDKYEHSNNDIKSVFFSVNKPWYYAETEIINQIMDINEINNCNIDKEILELYRKLGNGERKIAREGIKEGLHIKDLSIFMRPYVPGFNKSKRVWENCARILYHKSDEELMPYLEQMFEWLQDLNWPGALIISKRLYEFSKNHKCIFDTIKDKCIKRAKENNDKIWIIVINEIKNNAENKEGYWFPEIYI